MKYAKKAIRLLQIFVMLETVFAIHEYGHLREYQLLNIPVEEFSLGIGPILYHHEGPEYDINVRAVPIAAYVMPTEEGYKSLVLEGTP